MTLALQLNIQRQQPVKLPDTPLDYEAQAGCKLQSVWAPLGANVSR